MRIGAFSFSPGLVATVAGGLLFALLVFMGRWQLNRAEEKQERQLLLDARMVEAPVRLTGSVASADSLLFRRVLASGEWIADGQIFIDNQIHDGRAGFAVITPLRLNARNEALLVNRGWIARNADYPRAPDVPVPPGRVEVSGLASLPPARFLELSGDIVTGNVWQNLSIERVRSRTRLDVLPVVVLADTPAPGLAPLREKPDAGVAKHQEYALTWFALAATTLVLWIALNLKRQR